jgi:hypothetical protein
MGNAANQASFAGSDLKVTFGNRTIGELQSISWAIERKKAPVYTLGNQDPRAFSRGIRGIAGSLVFAVFDRDALYEELSLAWKDIAPKAMFTAAGNKVQRTMAGFEKALSMTAWDAATAPATGDAVDGSAFTVDIPAGFDLITAENVVYSDMLPPFDITMTFANEYGQAAFQKIYDVDILNEGSGVATDTVIMERQMTYVCRRVSPIMQGVYLRDSNSQKRQYVNAK